jgi:hypothetical protein
MDNPKLRRALEQLRKEIDSIQDVDEKGKNLLNEIRADIQSILEHNEDDSFHPKTTKKRLEDSIIFLEATHPDITSILSELLNILSNAGI